MKIEHLETVLAVYRCQSLFDRYKTYPVCGRRISRWTFWYRYATVNLSFILLFTFFGNRRIFPYTKRGKMNICIV